MLPLYPLCFLRVCQIAIQHRRYDLKQTHDERQFYFGVFYTQYFFFRDRIRETIFTIFSHTRKKNNFFIVLLTDCIGLHSAVRVHNKYVWGGMDRYKTMNNDDNYIFGIDVAIQTITST